MIASRLGFFTAFPATTLEAGNIVLFQGRPYTIHNNNHHERRFWAFPLSPEDVGFINRHILQVSSVPMFHVTLLPDHQRPPELIRYERGDCFYLLSLHPAGHLRWQLLDRQADWISVVIPKWETWT